VARHLGSIRKLCLKGFVNPGRLPRIYRPPDEFCPDGRPYGHNPESIIHSEWQTRRNLAQGKRPQDYRLAIVSKPFNVYVSRRVVCTPSRSRISSPQCILARDIIQTFPVSSTSTIGETPPARRPTSALVSNPASLPKKGFICARSGATQLEANRWLSLRGNLSGNRHF